jgi:hypothetical protein
MKLLITAVIVVSALAVGVADVYAMAWGGGRGRSHGTSALGGESASVPEPSTLYALSSGLALLGGAGWYIRRRK